MSRVASISPFDHRHDLFHAAGWVDGGVITDAGSNTIDVTAGIGFLHIANSHLSDIKYIDWSLTEGLSVPSNTTRIIIVQYNSGSPVVVAQADEADRHDEFDLGQVVNENGTLHIIPHQQTVVDAITNITQRFHGTKHVERDTKTGGLILGESADNNQYITVSAGKLWMGVTDTSISTFDTSGSDRFDRYLRDGVSSNFTRQSAQQIWDNLQFDSNGVLTTLSASKYTAQYFYLETDGGVVCMYGRAEYSTLAKAEDDVPPATLPDRLLEHSLLIGRIVFQKSDTIPQSVESVFVETFNIAGVTDHANLSGITANQHHNAVESIDDLTDVDTTTDAPNLNEVLKWDESNWVPGPAGAGLTEHHIPLISGGAFDTTGFT